MVSVDISHALQEKVVLNEGGQIQLWDHFVHPTLQDGPESAACQVLQGTRSPGQREDGLKEDSVLLMGLKQNIKGFKLSVVSQLGYSKTISIYLQLF